MLPTNYLFTDHIFNKYMYKEDLALDNQQSLICYEIQPTNLKLFDSVQTINSST